MDFQKVQTSKRASRIESTWSGGVQSWKLMGLRATSKPPPRMHFGLGEDAVAERSHIRWPDGEVSIYDQLLARRRVTAIHSQAAR